MSRKLQFRHGLAWICATATALFFETALADTTSYCDSKCGDTQKCQYTCCHVTTKKIGGIDYVTNVNCSHSTCCAHPEGWTPGAGSVLTLPGTRLDPIPGRIKGAMVASQFVDASLVTCITDTNAKTVTLEGTVPSKPQRDRAGVIAATEAKEYKIINHLKVGPEGSQKKR
jgi:hypothetical protein